MNNPHVTAEALALLRSGQPFNWSVITLLALVLYVYFNEISKKNWRGVRAALALYTVHWLAEIVNGLVQHATGHALWTVPTGTSFLLLVGVGVELSLMFSIAGLIMTKILPDDPRRKVLGINNRVLFVVGNAAFFSIFEIFLVRTPAFVWVWPWWGAFPVFVLVYIPFFLAAWYGYDGRPERAWAGIAGLAVTDVLALIVFGGFLGWI